MPFEFDLRSSWEMFWKNWRKIVPGTLRFILSHPIACWPVLVARIYCIFAPCPWTVRVPEGFYVRNFYEFYVYAQLFIERNLAQAGYLGDFSKEPHPEVIDVGANVGMFSQWLGNYNPRAIFYAFEPCLEHYHESRRILSERFLNVHTNCCAVGDIDGTATLAFTDRVALGPIGRATRMVRILRLDSCHFDDPIFLLKIDTDGSNLKVLAGARETLKKCRFVLIEKESDYWDYFPSNLWHMTDLGDDLLFERITWRKP